MAVSERSLRRLSEIIVAVAMTDCKPALAGLFLPFRWPLSPIVRGPVLLLLVACA